MSGHSKWANIKNKKAKTDAVRGRVFTKIGREIAVAAKQGSDPSTNSKLADVIAKAKAANMPNDNIMRSIKKAAGELSGVNYESLTYEGYGPGGSAIIVTTLTDNKTVRSATCATRSTSTAARWETPAASPLRLTTRASSSWNARWR